jgi:hypothetical protein
VLVVGSLLALFCGVANSVAAALEKRESLVTDQRVRGVRLLGVLVRRPVWLLAMVLSALAWVAEAASLGLAPVPVVATLRSSGRGLLVVSGSRWLGESFSRLELVAVVLATLGGVVTAVGSTASTVSYTTLSLPMQAVVAAAAAAVALVVSRWHNGVTMGAAVGVLFAATGIFTKQIADLFAVDGLGAVEHIVASLTLWAMIAMSVWAQNLLQGAFRRANAASVAAANAAVASLGLVVAGFLLYGEKFPAGWAAAALVGGIAVSLAGTAMLAVTSGGSPAPGVPTPGPQGEGEVYPPGASDAARRSANQRRSTPAHSSSNTPGRTSNS